MPFHSSALLHNTSPELSSGRMADMEAYLRLIEDVHEWPFQSSTLVLVVLTLFTNPDRVMVRRTADRRHAGTCLGYIMIIHRGPGV